MESYSPNFLAVVGFKKMLADLFPAYYDIFAYSKTGLKRTKSKKKGANSGVSFRGGNLCTCSALNGAGI